MTTLVLDLTPRLAADVARGADAIDGGISHEEFAVRAIQLLLRSMYGKTTGRPVGYRPSKFSEAGQARSANRVIARRRARIRKAQSR